MSLQEFIVTYEKQLRITFFIVMLVIMAVWEFIAPKRQLIISRSVRWSNNLAIVFLNSYLLRIVFPAAAVGAAVFASAHGWGLLNYYALPFWLSVILSVVALDFFIYLQHVMVHAIPLLWRLHRVHHADPDFDFTTGSRFHPFEILFSMCVKFAVIFVLGPPVVAVILFEIILNISSMFNHGNVDLPESVDRILRLFLVTPDMHRVHHSIEDDETNSNFGFCLPWWDRLFGTYRAQPREGHTDMTIGIHRFRDAKQVSWLHGMLILPFLGKLSGYTINRRTWSKPDEP
jgi:sterol desaturase/sphingolipid hydroxylase (fatty acid hydroxylase superfamily)